MRELCDHGTVLCVDYGGDTGDTGDTGGDT